METIWEALLGMIQYAASLVCVAACCAFPPAVIGLAFYIFGIRPQNAHIRQLGEQMGFQPVDPRRGRRFGGVYHGHEVSIGYGLRSSPRLGGGRHHSGALSVHVDLQLREPLRGRVGFSGGPARADDAFESAFRQEAPIQRLSAASRAAMLAFARKYDNFWLEAFRPETTPRLEHTLGSIHGTTPDSLRAVLDDMLEVARTIEGDW